MISPVSFKTLAVDLAGVWTHDLPLGRPVLFQLSQPGGGLLVGKIKMIGVVLNVVHLQIHKNKKGVLTAFTTIPTC